MQAERHRAAPGSPRSLPPSPAGTEAAAGLEELAGHLQAPMSLV